MILRAYSCLFAQGSPLMGLGGPHGVPGVEPQSTICKASALSTLLSLCPPPVLPIFIS